MREHLVNLALKLVGCPYVWGGGNPWVGFDCSGFVIWLYQVFGLLPSGDWTAQGLYEHFRRPIEEKVPLPETGDLVFYGASVQKISHVMLALAGGLVVGASGGDRECTTPEAARRRGAMVKVKPVNYRRDEVVTVHVVFPGE